MTKPKQNETTFRGTSPPWTAQAALALNTLLSIFSAIIVNPHEPKFRALNVESHRFRQIFFVNGVLLILEANGFQHTHGQTHMTLSPRHSTSEFTDELVSLSDEVIARGNEIG
eukprot:c9514_g1_i2.p2 GENE.c9514_g1_i2~~c9514_g1_i2.p2  ORF type:complete len:113 (+),score=14.33 c9514_g1_i2:456-794(+)